MFRPKKNYLYIVYKGNENPEMVQKCEEGGLDISYTPRWKEYSIQLSGFEEYLKHKELIDSLIKSSMEYFNISD